LKITFVDPTGYAFYLYLATLHTPDSSITQHTIPKAEIPYLFKLPIRKKNGELSYGCFIAGVIISDWGGRIYVKESNKRKTVIGIKIPCKKEESSSWK
jgi:signal transduction histidine kinase